MTEHTWKPDVFIYHSPCDDGFGAAWAVHQKWGYSVEYIPATYGQPVPIERVVGKNVLIGDFSYKYDLLLNIGTVARSVVILDHHKTAQEDLNAFGEPCFSSHEDVLLDLDSCEDTEISLPIVAKFDMEKSGARMVWEFCHPGEAVPLLIQYIEDRDLWRFAMDNTRGISLYLRSHAYDFDEWTIIANRMANEGERNGVMFAAASIEQFYDQKIAEMLRTAKMVKINGISVPIVNCSWAFASDVAHALLEQFPEAPFAATHYDRGDGSRSFSLRSEDSRQDVSLVAKRYGGGGHRNAAGFEVPVV